MTLRPEYSLGHSEYNAFLFAAVGEDKVGLPLTVLTALTRLGFDPWREAARLSDLPRETAARAFAVTIAMLPEGDWKVSDSEAISTARSGTKRCTRFFIFSSGFLAGPKKLISGP